MVEYIVMQHVFVSELDTVLNRHSRNGWYLVQWVSDGGILVMARKRGGASE